MPCRQPQRHTSRYPCRRTMRRYALTSITRLSASWVPGNALNPRSQRGHCACSGTSSTLAGNASARATVAAPPTLAVDGRR